MLAKKLKHTELLKQKEHQFLDAFLSGRQDSNLRPPGPKPGALPACATSRAVANVRIVVKKEGANTIFLAIFKHENGPVNENHPGFLGLWDPCLPQQDPLAGIRPSVQNDTGSPYRKRGYARWQPDRHPSIGYKTN